MDCLTHTAEQNVINMAESFVHVHTTVQLKEHIQTVLATSSRSSFTGTLFDLQRKDYLLTNLKIKIISCHCDNHKQIGIVRTHTQTYTHIHIQTGSPLHITIT